MYITDIKHLQKYKAPEKGTRGLVKEEYLVIILGYFFLIFPYKHMLWELIKSTSSGIPNE